MSDPLKGFTVHVGGQTRTIKYTMAAFRVAKKSLGVETIRSACLRMEPGDVIDLAAAGLVSTEKGVTPERMTAWLDADPTAYVPLATAVASAVAEAYGRMIPAAMLEAKEATVGEGVAATTTDAPTSGDSIASLAASVST